MFGLILLRHRSRNLSYTKIYVPCSAFRINNNFILPLIGKFATKNAELRTANYYKLSFQEDNKSVLLTYKW